MAMKQVANMSQKPITVSQCLAEIKKMERNGERPRTPKPTRSGRTTAGQSG